MRPNMPRLPTTRCHGTWPPPTAPIIDAAPAPVVIDGALTSALVPSTASRTTEPTRRAGAPTEPGDLTDRELQVVQLLAEGLSNKLIADRLQISDHTAKFHVGGVMTKLAAATRTEAVVEAMRRGLIAL